MKHLHLDPLGGVAGDMMVACMLDAWPALADGAIAAVRAAGVGPEVAINHLPVNDGILAGSGFKVMLPPSALHHDHVDWQHLRARLRAAPLDDAVGRRALDIFGRLAAAEA